MIIYHGSKYKIDRPTYKGSKEDNDYGPAFYLSKDLQSAHEWACRNNTVGYINKYKLDMTSLRILDLTDKTKYSVLNWIAILLHYRILSSSFVNAFKVRLDYLEEHYFINPYDYDVVIGNRADDAYFRFPLDFVRGNLTLEQLEASFNLGELGIQYVLMSEKAISHLRHIDSYLSNPTYVDKYYERVEIASSQYDALPKDEDGTRIFDIIKGTKQ